MRQIIIKISQGNRPDKRKRNKRNRLKIDTQIEEDISKPLFLETIVFLAMWFTTDHLVLIVPSNAVLGDIISLKSRILFISSSQPIPQSQVITNPSLV